MSYTPSPPLVLKDRNPTQNWLKKKMEILVEKNKDSFRHPWTQGSKCVSRTLFFFL